MTNLLRINVRVSPAVVWSLTTLGKLLLWRYSFERSVTPIDLAYLKKKMSTVFRDICEVFFFFLSRCCWLISHQVLHLVWSLLLGIGPALVLHHLNHAYFFSERFGGLVFNGLDWNMSYWLYYLLCLAFLIFLNHFWKNNWDLVWVNRLKVTIPRCIRIDQFALMRFIIYVGNYPTMLGDTIIKHTNFNFQLSNNGLPFSEKGKC